VRQKDSSGVTSPSFLKKAFSSSKYIQWNHQILHSSSFFRKIYVDRNDPESFIAAFPKIYCFELRQAKIEIVLKLSILESRAIKN